MISTMHRILIADPIHEQAHKLLASRPGFEVAVATGSSESELVERIPAYDGIIVRSKTRVTAPVIAAGQKLKVIGRAGIGVDNIDVAAATERGIVVLNTPDANATTTAELTLAHLLSLSRHLPQADRSVRAGEWQPANFVGTELSGNKQVLMDEVEASAVTERLVTRALLKRSEVSGKHAEPEYFSHCEFTNTEALESELAVSELSGKRYRPDDQERSALSGKTGHKQEFTLCHETGMPIGIVEAELCELTGALVRPEVLRTCEVSGKRALPSEFLRCSVTGKRVQKGLLVVSNLSQLPLLVSMAIRSAAGNFCLPAEAKACVWSGRKCHPEDIRVCSLTGLSIHFAFAIGDRAPQLRPLVDILGGESRAADETPRWNEISIKLSAELPGAQGTLEAAVLSPDRGCLAICSKAKTLLGLRVQHIGAVYWLGEATFIGRIVRGKRGSRGWAPLT